VSEALLTQLAVIVALGIAVQWFAWRLRLPAIVLLLAAGIVAGPVTGFLDPDRLLGDALLPIVSLSVAVILFEGGLSLRIAEVRGVGGAVTLLVSVGALVTWIITTGAAHFIVGLDLSLAVLLGAILTVTGPTVVTPLLRHVRPAGKVGAILKWEGIVIDPIGAVLAIIVYEAVFGGGQGDPSRIVAIGVGRTLLVGGLVGIAGAVLKILILKRFWAPDYLENPVSVALVFTAFAGANYLQPESGLLAVTVMGVALANQRIVPVHHIIEFKENLRVLLISVLFILLAARLRPDVIAEFGFREALFLAVLIVIVRPAAVFTATLVSKLSHEEKLFLASVAPRGIVAAAVSSVFALRLSEAGHPDAQRLLSLTFLVIIASVVVYGLAALPMARRLGLAQPEPQGLLVAGAQAFAQQVAKVLGRKGFRVLLVDTNAANVARAREAGLSAQQVNVLSENERDELDLAGIGRVLALTPNDGVNSLIARNTVDLFGRAGVYQLTPEPEPGEGKRSTKAAGRLLFHKQATCARLHELLGDGWLIREVGSRAEDSYIPLFVISDSGKLQIVTAGSKPAPKEGQELIALAAPLSEHVS
jgi:NhaP-type Na+/H+ or K+/H+ antiporter